MPSRESERVRSSFFAKKTNDEVSDWYHESKYWLFATFARLFLTQTKGRREKERERKRKGKEEEGKEKGKEEREREIGSEALAETEKIANAPAGNRTRNPSKRG